MHHSTARCSRKQPSNRARQRSRGGTRGKRKRQIVPMTLRQCVPSRIKHTSFRHRRSGPRNAERAKTPSRRVQMRSQPLTSEGRFLRRSRDSNRYKVHPCNLHSPVRQGDEEGTARKNGSSKRAHASGVQFAAVPKMPSDQDAPACTSRQVSTAKRMQVSSTHRAQRPF